MKRAATLAFWGLLAATVSRAALEQPVDNARYPTAGIIPDREYRLQGRMTQESGLQGGARLGIRDRAQIGVFYGAQHLVETGSPTLNDHIGLELKVRVVEEGRWPAVALGFESQGWYVYSGADERYQRKSLGFYAVASRNWRSFAGDLSLHGGANYSLERKDGDDSPTIFLAGDWTIASRVSLLSDFGAAWNDNTPDGRYGEGGVYLDMGIRVALGDHLQLMLVFSDLTTNLAPGEKSGRELEVVYINRF